MVALVKEDVDKEVEEFRILPSRYVWLDWKGKLCKNFILFPCFFLC